MMPRKMGDWIKFGLVLAVVGVVGHLTGIWGRLVGLVVKK